MSARLLDVDVHNGRARPRYLGQRDEAWVRALLGAIDRQEGRRTASAARAIRGAAQGIARHYEVKPEAVSLLLALEKARWAARTVADVDPERVRAVVFELAARLPRDQALARAAEALGMESAAITEALFADHPDRTLFVAPYEDATPAAAIVRYNRALLLELLARASVITAPAADPFALSSFAKSWSLLCAFTSEPRIHLAGPLALANGRAAYSRSLSAFLPALPSLSARLHFEGQTVRLDLDALPFEVVRPERWDVVDVVARSLAGSACSVAAVRRTVVVGDHLFVPDLEVRSLFETVLVDLRPRHTPEGLARAQAIASAAPEPIVVVPWRSSTASFSDAKRLLSFVDQARPACLRAAPRSDPAS